MHKEVSAIFKTLIGTAVLIVVISLFTEIVNISLSGIQLQQTVKLSCEKALTLFAQESYKERTDTNNASGNALGGSVNMPNIQTKDGTDYVDGTFYSGSDVQSIYNSLYAKSSNPSFSNWVDSSEIKDNWQSITLLNQYLNGSFSITSMPSFETYMSGTSDIDAAYESYERDMDIYTDYLIGKSYVDTYMTPLNFGVPYIDEPTVNKMFRWNLTQMLSNCNSDAIVNDPDDPLNPDRYFVEIDGFRVYADMAQITDVEYRVFDLTSTSDAKEFKRLTNIDPDNLGFEFDNYLGTNDDERQRICIISVKYTVPVSYIGITPIKSIFNWAWNNEVEGYYSQFPGGVTKPNLSYNYGVSNLEGGGFRGDVAGVLPVPGKLIFYLVR